jgi:hypothetical protein
MFHASVASSALCIEALNQIQRSMGSMLPTIIPEIGSFHIISVWRNADFFREKGINDVKP